MQEQQSGQGLTLGLTSTPVKIILKDCNAWILGDKMVVFIALRWLVCKPWELATQASQQHLNSIWTMLDPRVWNCTKTTLEILSSRMTAITFGGDLGQRLILMMAMMITMTTTMVMMTKDLPESRCRSLSGPFEPSTEERRCAYGHPHQPTHNRVQNISLKCRAHRHLLRSTA